MEKPFAEMIGACGENKDTTASLERRSKKGRVQCTWLAPAQASELGPRLNPGRFVYSIATTVSLVSYR